MLLCLNINRLISFMGNDTTFVGTLVMEVVSAATQPDTLYTAKNKHLKFTMEW